MRQKQRFGCRIHGHEWLSHEEAGWVTYTCRRCQAVTELPASAARASIEDHDFDVERTVRRRWAWTEAFGGDGSPDAGGGGE